MMEILFTGEPADPARGRSLEDLLKDMTLMLCDAYPDLAFEWTENTVRTVRESGEESPDPDVAVLLPSRIAVDAVSGAGDAAVLRKRLAELRAQYPNAMLAVAEPFCPVDAGALRDSAEDLIGEIRLAAAEGADSLIPLDGMIAAETVAHPDIPYFTEDARLTPEGVCIVAECILRTLTPTIDSLLGND